MSAAQPELIVEGRHRDPFSFLGPHKGQIRAWLPQAKDAAVLAGGEIDPDEAHASSGALHREDRERQPTTASASRSTPAKSQEIDDPYRFPPLLTPFELHLHGEGTNYESYRHPGRARGCLRRRGRRALRGVGSERRSRQRHRRSSTVGIARAIPCVCATAASGRFFMPGLGRRRALQVFRADRRAAASRITAIPTGSSPRFRPRPRPSSGRSRITTGATRRGWSSARSATGCASRSRSTKCIWNPGCAGR